MIIGEFRKIFRNKVFLVVMAAIFAANIVCILYHAKTKSEYYYEAKQQEQQQYIETYRTYLNGMESRAQELLATFDEDTPAFLRRNIEKTQRDYSGLLNPWIDATYNVGMEEYAQYTYGSFFGIIFAFACLEYLYLMEKQTGRLAILRTTKNGRRRMILSKWCVFLLMVAGFTVLQELITVGLYAGMESVGNLSSPVQSLPLFRDCPHAYEMLQGIFLTILHRVILMGTVGSVIFFCGVVFDNVILAFVVPCAWLVLQYIFAATLSVNSSWDILCSVNFFHSWDMRNYVGMYYNLNVFGWPVEKNVAVLAGNGLLLLCTIVVGSRLFAVRYQAGYQRHEWKILQWLRRQLSKVLHGQSLFVNELYKLLFQQKKWVLVAVFALIFAGSADYYVPKDSYGFLGESTYHMYLLNLKGEFTEESEQYIVQAREKLDALVRQMEKANEEGDSALATQLYFELWDKEAGYQRLEEQHQKLLAHPEAERYWIDEIYFNFTLIQFDRDVLLFMVSAVLMILLTSGLFASEKENKIANLVGATRNGREKLLRSKLLCCGFWTVLLYVFTQLPSWIGYAHILDWSSVRQRLDLMVVPQPDSSMTLLELLALIYAIKLVLDGIIVALTVLMARKTKNEFVTLVFMSTVVIIVCLVMYFLGKSVSTLVVSLL